MKDPKIIKETVIVVLVVLGIMVFA